MDKAVLVGDGRPSFHSSEYVLLESCTLPTKPFDLILIASIGFRSKCQTFRK
jgi:hypothetical protein